MEYSDICCKVEATTDSQLKNISKIPESLVIQYLNLERAFKSVSLKVMYLEGEKRVVVNEMDEVILAETTYDKSYSREEVINLINKLFVFLGKKLEVTFKSKVKNSKGKSRLSVYDDNLNKWIEDNV